MAHHGRDARRNHPSTTVAARDTTGATLDDLYGHARCRVALPARNNQWDHVPPVQGYTAGNDVMILTGTAWDTTGATLDGIACP